MNLIIDIGNTRVKLAVFKNSKLIHNESITLDIFEIKAIELIKIYKCSYAIISSVGSEKKSQFTKISSKIHLIELNSNVKLPFNNKYATPKTLGVDRLALIAAAISKFPQKNVLIIDAGSCITYDFVNMKANYLGGAISPGINMRYKSLHTFTKNLPLLEINNAHQLIGDATDLCMHSGVINGVINEIDSFINQYKEKNQDLTVVLTGGDTNFLANRLKNSIFANPNFLLEGLNTILIYNLL